MIASAILMTFAAIMAFGAAMDLLTMTIPNRVSVALVALFPIAAIILGLPAEALLMHLCAGLLVLAAGIFLFAVGGFGGGDAKLLAAAALWIGFDQLLPFLALVTVFGGVLSIAILYYRRLPILGVHAPDWAMKLHKQGTGIPYGIAITCSALMVLPMTPWAVVAALG
ncbi:A24 family peptidase [Hyphomicrobium sp.]|uniref:A24 family peptidase n=1 Tax=Hyphomicrobium sp. TaxID=82 RepID=UPI002E35ACB8|nr:prepilin peptidase [Hyphomicrobium sp.]HEX2841931.1 prepilin peptidase [Hyphomicrobium sp.]